ncbi:MULTISPECIES: hypothetical protein [Lactobacillus]|nr:MULTISPECIES: hypothetical protein [Lactobacillus]
MAKKSNEEKKKMLEIKRQIAKWTAIGAWSIPALPIAQAIYAIVKHLLRN